MLPKSITDLKPEEQAALIDFLLNKPCLRRKDLTRRYGIDVRTIDRWKADGTLPVPTYYHGPLWSLAQIITAETDTSKIRRYKTLPVVQDGQKTFLFK
jgi:hypothetical protein